MIKLFSLVFRYSKVEDLKPDGPEIQQFSHLLIGVSSPEMLELEPYKNTHAQKGVIAGLARVEVTGLEFPFFRIVLEPKVAILKRTKIGY